MTFKRGFAPLIAAVVGSALSSSVGLSAVIWSNPITGTNPNTANPYTTGDVVLSGVSVSGIGRGNGLATANANDRYNASGWGTGSTLDTALNDFFSFTITPNSGTTLDLTNFVYTGQASGNGPGSFAFRSSVDNYATNIGTPNANGTTISLTAAAYQNLTSAITFRLYGWNANNAGGTYSINDFTFNGDINNSDLSVPSTATITGLRGGTLQTTVVVSNAASTSTTAFTAAASNSFTVSPTSVSSIAGGATSSLTVTAPTSATGVVTSTVSITNSNNPADTNNLATTVTANIYDSAVLAAGTQTGTAAGTANVVGAGSSFALARVQVPTANRNAGFVNVTGNLTNGPVLVLLDLIDSSQTESLRSTLAGLGLTVSSTSPVLSRYNYTGVNYDLVVTLNPTAATLGSGSWQYRYDFSPLANFSGIANIGIVPEARSIMGLVVPGALLLMRRRRA